MKDMLKIASGFQYSVNIAFDLYNDEKLKNYIPTKNALDFIAEIIASTDVSAKDRARVLIGAYGRGKSHIVLNIVSLLMQRDKHLFQNIWQADTEHKLSAIVNRYYENCNKLLPVIISGSNTSLTQAFIISLQRALQDNQLLDVMPETNYQAAAKCIERWEHEYPDVYGRLAEAVDMPVTEFTAALQNYDIGAYKQFEQIYPALTAGSMFNPFLGFDVVELYESVAKAIAAKGYGGIFVVYDEFSKYLEANIKEATVSDTKMLQDFAEKCNRSGELQMHLLLICHKEIANYINKLPKEKTDGWRGVSERFKHIQLTNNFAQIYEVVSKVIKKDQAKWAKFLLAHKDLFQGWQDKYGKSRMFADVDDKELCQVFECCYPLHPVSLFLLPRLSEKIAQNERTLFTFLSAEGRFTMSAFIAQQPADEEAFILPDLIYDYFQPLMQKEFYTGDIHQQYVLVSAAVQDLSDDSVETKLIKTIALIYIVGEFEKLSPKADVLLDIYGNLYGYDVVEKALLNLEKNNLMVRLRRNNGFLRLKESSGVDVWQKIHDGVAAAGQRYSAKEILNSMNFERYVYPSRYNDEKEMTRYFQFEFIDGDEIADNNGLAAKSGRIHADGIIYGVLPRDEEQLAKIRSILPSAEDEKIIFVLPKEYSDISRSVRELEAVAQLRAEAANDKVLCSEYGIIYDDLYEVADDYIKGFVRPEAGTADYFYQGVKKQFFRKSQLSEFLSQIMDKLYADTPVINNEVVNKDEITSVAITSRSKVIAGLLRSELEYDLGLKGSGQDMAIMRSTLLRTGVLQQDNVQAISLNLSPRQNIALANVLQRIKNMLWDELGSEKMCMAKVYDYLINPAYHVGMRRGIIPIYLAAVLHGIKKGLVFSNSFGEVSLDAELLHQINIAPENFFVEKINWNEAKEKYLYHLEKLFADYMEYDAQDAGAANYNQVYMAMERWYRALPRYSKEITCYLDGRPLEREMKKFINIFRNRRNSAREALFIAMPAIWNISENYAQLSHNIMYTKKMYDEASMVLLQYLGDFLRRNFLAGANPRATTVSVLKNWLDGLPAGIMQEAFADNTDRFLQIIQEASADEQELIQKMSSLLVGLRVEDWSFDEVAAFKAKVMKHKEAAENYHADIVPDVGCQADFIADVNAREGYEIKICDEQGICSIKRFDKIVYAPRGKRVLNALNARLNEAGQGLTMAEKRQIVMELLSGLL